MAKKERKSEAAMRKSETKAARFIRVVTPRVSKAVKAISVIGYCASSTYEFNSQQVEQIMKVLSKAQNELLAKFAGKKTEQEEFSFKT